MVKIEEKPLEQRMAEDHCNRLLAIAREMFGNEKRVDSFGRSGFTVGSNSEIMVQTGTRMIYVKSSAMLDDAVKLAQAYEQLLGGGKEVVVQKDY